MLCLYVYFIFIYNIYRIRELHMTYMYIYTYLYKYTWLTTLVPFFTHWPGHRKKGSTDAFKWGSFLAANQVWVHKRYIKDCIIFKEGGLDSIGFPFCLKTKQHTAWILLIVAWMFVLDLTMRWDSWLMTHEPIIVLNVVARWWSLLEIFFHWKLLTTGSTSPEKWMKSSLRFCLAF